jgi:predicted HicB family RNase H-like nuclease
MKRITLEVDDQTHAELVALAKDDGRALVRYIERLLMNAATKGTIKRVKA